MPSFTKNISPEAAISNKYNPKIAKAIRFIYNNRYFKQISMNELTNEAGMSVKYFQKAFKTATGKTPAKYIYDLRMTEAMDYVSRTPKSIDEILDIFVFSSHAYFLKKFKEYYGKPPSEYRKN